MVGVAETSGWYDPAVYPELRSAAPWVMEDMIEAQVMLPEALGDSLASSAPQLVEMMHAAADAGEPIVVSAVGTSGHSARAVALILNGAMGESAVAAGPAEARESADEALAPRRRGLCIAISHGGLSTSTVRALAAAREAGAKTALITAADNTPARDIADVVLVTPLRDKSYCHTVGYTSPMLAGFYLASAYRQEEFPAAGVGRYLGELLTMRTRALEIGGELGKVERLVSAGSLVDVPTARELALKVAEGAWVPTTMLGVEDTLHGHLVAHDANSALVVVVTGGPGADRAAEGRTTAADGSPQDRAADSSDPQPRPGGRDPERGRHRRQAGDPACGAARTGDLPPRRRRRLAAADRRSGARAKDQPRPPAKRAGTLS